MSRRRRWLFVFVLTLLVGASGGAYYVFKIAKTRTSPYKQAVAALERGDKESAETQLRRILEANPSDDRARGLLIDVLAATQRNAEAEALARHWLDKSATEALGLRALGQLALERADFAGAMQYARQVSDRDTAFAQMLLIQVNDLIGSPESRERSARAAETLALVADAPELRAEAWLFAAETLRELARSAVGDHLRDALDARSTLDQEKAREALRESPMWTGRFPEGKALMARIDLLSGSAEKEAAAIAELDEFLSSRKDAHLVRMSLIRHLIRQGQFGQAATSIEALRNAPALLFVRALAALAAAGERATVLALIAESPASEASILDLVRARVLITGEGEEREQGIQAFEMLSNNNKDDETLVREGFLRIRAAGDLDRALRLLETTGLEDPDIRFSVLLERTANAISSGQTDEIDDLLQSLASEAQGPKLVVALNRIRAIKGSGETASIALIDKALAAQGSNGDTLRLLRVILRLSHSGDAAEGASSRALAVQDLTELAVDAGSSRAVLVDGAKLAVQAGEPHLAGRLLGRALGMDGPMGDLLRFYISAASDLARAAREQAAQGMRDEAQGSSSSWVEQLADALAGGDLATLRRPSSQLTSPEGETRQLEVELQGLLALRAGDLDEAAAYCQKTLQAHPGRAGDVERLAAILLAARKYDDVLQLHPGADLTALHQTQRIEALSGLKRDEEALTEARLLVSKTKGSDLSLLILGKLLRESNPDAALAAISPISARGNADLRFRAELLRGELLQRRGEDDTAGLIYEELLRESGNRHMESWERLAQTRATQQRDAFLIGELTAVLEAPPRGMPAGDLAGLVLIRAQARERIHDYQRALEDYRLVIKAVPKNVVALNNCAWILATHIPWSADERPRRLAEAIGYITRAGEAAPHAAPLFHTQAKILEAMDKPKEALLAYDTAIQELTRGLDQAVAKGAKPDGLVDVRSRRARYQLDKAALLEQMGNTHDARGIYEAVHKQEPESSEGRQADRALQRLGQ